MTSKDRVYFMANKDNVKEKKLGNMIAKRVVGLVGGAAIAGVLYVLATLGTASTGTAIASLSGAAAKNAALAILGGGTLADGGFGIAGGVVVLGVTGVVGAIVSRKIYVHMTEKNKPKQ